MDGFSEIQRLGQKIDLLQPNESCIMLTKTATFYLKGIKCNVIYNKRVKDLTVIDFGLVQNIF